MEMWGYVAGAYFFLLFGGGDCVLFCCLRGGMFLFFAVWAGAAPAHKQHPRPNTKKTPKKPKQQKRPDNPYFTGAVHETYDISTPDAPLLHGVSVASC